MSCNLCKQDSYYDITELECKTCISKYFNGCNTCSMLACQTCNPGYVMLNKRCTLCL